MEKIQVSVDTIHLSHHKNLEIRHNGHTYCVATNSSYFRVKLTIIQKLWNATFGKLIPSQAWKQVKISVASPSSKTFAIGYVFLSRFPHLDTLKSLSNDEIQDIKASLRQNPALFKDQEALARSNKDIAMEAVIASLENINHLPSSLLDDTEYLKDVLTATPLAYTQLKDPLKLNPDLAFAALKADPTLANLLPTSLLANKKFLKQAINIDPKLFAKAPQSLKNDPELALEVLKKDQQLASSIPDSLWQNESFVLHAIDVNPLFYKKASFELKSSPQLAHVALQKDESLVLSLPSHLFSQKDFMIEAAKLRPALLAKLDALLKKDPELAFMCYKMNHDYLKYFSKEVWSNAKFVKKMVQINGLYLANASLDLQNNKDVVSEACSQNGWALKFASKKLKSDLDLVKIAVINQPLSLQFSCLSLRDNLELAKLALKSNLEAQAFIAEDTLDTIWSDREFVIAQVAKDGSCLKEAGLELKNDIHIARSACLNNPQAFRYVGKSLWDNREFVSFAVSQNGLFLKKASPDLQNDPQIISLALQNDPLAAQFASSHVLSDASLAKLAVGRDIRAQEYFPDTILDEIWKDAEFVKVAINKDPMLLKYASKSLRSDENIVVMAVEKNGLSLDFASRTLKQNPKIIQKALLNNFDAKRFCRAEDINRCFVDKEFLEKMISKNGLFLANAPILLRKDRAICLKALTTSKDAISFFDASVFQDQSFCKQLIQLEPRLFFKLPQALQLDPELALEAIKLKPELAKSINGSLFENRSFVKGLMNIQGLWLQFMLEEFQEDKDIVLNAVSQNGYSLKFASSDLKEDLDIVKAACLSKPQSLEYASDMIKNSPEIVRYLLLESLSDDKKKIGDTCYLAAPIPDSISQEMKTASAAHDGSMTHLIYEDLESFINSWSLEDHPQQINVKTEKEFLEAKQIYKAHLKLLQSRIEHHTPYLGTPPAEQKDYVDAFYMQIKTLLSKLDGALRDDKNAKEERMVILEGAAVCGGGLLGRLEQLDEQLVKNKNLSIEAMCAKLIAKDAKLAIEALNTSTDVHESNIMQYQLHEFIGGQRIQRDTLVDLYEMPPLLLGFHNFHFAKRIVDSVLLESRDNEFFQEKIKDYIETHILNFNQSTPFQKQRLQEQHTTLKKSLQEVQLNPRSCLQKFGAGDKAKIISAISRSNQLPMIKALLKNQGLVMNDTIITDLLKERATLLTINSNLIQIAQLTGMKHSEILKASEKTILLAFQNHISQRARDIMREDFENRFMQEGELSREAVALILSQMGLLEKI